MTMRSGRKMWVLAAFVLAGSILTGCGTSGEKVSDGLMFWKPSEQSKRAQPTRYDGRERSAAVPAESIDVSPDAAEAAIAASSEDAVPNVSPAEDPQEAGDPYEGLSVTERRRLEGIDKEADAIRAQYRVKSRLRGSIGF